MRRRAWTPEERSAAESAVGIEPLDRPAKPPVCADDHDQEPGRSDVGFRLWVLMWVLGIPSGFGLVIIADTAEMPGHPSVWGVSRTLWIICMVGFAPIAIGVVALALFLVGLFIRWTVTGRGI